MPDPSSPAARTWTVQSVSLRRRTGSDRLAQVYRRLLQPSAPDAVLRRTDSSPTKPPERS